MRIHCTINALCVTIYDYYCIMSFWYHVIIYIYISVIINVIYCNILCYMDAMNMAIYIYISLCVDLIYKHGYCTPWASPAVCPIEVLLLS